MGVLELITVAFVVLKLTNVIDWSWFQVFIPLISSFVLYVLIVIGWLIVVWRKV